MRMKYSKCPCGSPYLTSTATCPKCAPERWPAVATIPDGGYEVTACAYVPTATESDT